MGTIRERVQLLVEVVQKGLRPMMQNLQGFNKVMTQTTETFRQSQIQNTAFGNTGTRVANRVRLMTAGMRGFRMEMLGVMFFGMAMQRLFTSLLRPALELAGVFELMSVILGVFFLPIGLAVQDFLVNFGLKLLDIPESIRTFIGWVVVLGVILGLFLFVIGTLALGIGAIIVAFESSAIIGSIIAGIGAFFSAFGVAILVVIAFIIVAIIGFVLAWKTNFADIQGWTEVMMGGIKDIFGGLVDFFSGIGKVIWGAFIGDSDLVIEGFKLIGEGFVKAMDGLFKALLGAVVVLGISLNRVLMGILVTIAELILKFLSNVLGISTEKIVEWVSFLLTTLSTLIPGSRTILDGFLKSVEDIYRDINLTEELDTEMKSAKDVTATGLKSVVKTTELQFAEMNDVVSTKTDTFITLLEKVNIETSDDWLEAWKEKIDITNSSVDSINNAINSLDFTKIQEFKNLFAGLDKRITSGGGVIIPGGQERLKAFFEEQNSIEVTINAPNDYTVNVRQAGSE